MIYVGASTVQITHHPTLLAYIFGGGTLCGHLIGTVVVAAGETTTKGSLVVHSRSLEKACKAGLQPPLLLETGGAGIVLLQCFVIRGYSDQTISTGRRSGGETTAALFLSLSSTYLRRPLSVCVHACLFRLPYKPFLRTSNGVGTRPMAFSRFSTNSFLGGGPGFNSTNSSSRCVRPP